MKHLFSLTLVLATIAASAQTTPPPQTPKDKVEKPCIATVNNGRPIDSRPIETFYLANALQPNDGNEMLSALRLMLDPEVKVYLTPSQNSITIRATPESIAQAKQILAQIDRPSHIFRLTYTISESDAGKRVGVQHFTMIVANGQHTSLKEGSRVPIATGSYKPDSSSSEMQFTYLDVGLNFQATVTEFAEGVRLQSKVEQSTLAQERSGVGDSDPIVRQAVLEGASLLTLGKSQSLGSIDVPGSTRHLDIEVLAEGVK